MTTLIFALQHFVDVFGSDAALADDVGPKLTCIEAEALVGALRALGSDRAADMWARGHAAGDDEGDDHYPGPLVFTHPLAGYRTYQTSPEFYVTHYPAVLPNGLRSTGGRVTRYVVEGGVGKPVETVPAPDDDTAEQVIRRMLGLDSEGNQP
jgi:hypothetical protein